MFKGLKKAFPSASVQAGQVYRWRMVQASTMKWMDLSLNASGCTWGVYSRDGVFLRNFPRITNHITMGAANRYGLPQSVYQTASSV